MGVLISKRRVRSLLLIIPRRAEGVTHQGGTPSAPSVHRKFGQPAAAHDWEEWPVTRPKGGARVLRTGGRARRSFLPLRTLRAPDLLSLSATPLML